MKIYGKNSILERLKTNPQSIKKIFIVPGHEESGYIQKKAKKWGIPVYQVPGSKLQKLARDLNAQGILMEVEDYEYFHYRDLLETARDKHLTLVFLDELNDPQNLGGIIRSLACLGQFAVVIPTHKSVGVTETVLRVACGGDNYVKVARVSNLGPAIDLAKEAGFSIAGAVVKGGQSLFETKLPFPLGLVIGSEQKGIRDILQKKLDFSVTIPMAPSRLSLNVAQATTLLCYEVVRQRGRKAYREETAD